MCRQRDYTGGGGAGNPQASVCRTAALRELKAEKSMFRRGESPDTGKGCEGRKLLDIKVLSGILVTDKMAIS